MQATGCILLLLNAICNSEINNQANCVGIVFMDSVFDKSIIYIASIDAVITLGATYKLKVYELQI